jgi:hypothetical protein
MEENNAHVIAAATIALLVDVNRQWLDGLNEHA